jgi:hypothetical protein
MRRTDVVGMAIAVALVKPGIAALPIDMDVVAAVSREAIENSLLI